jgi:hypothetical protein
MSVQIYRRHTVLLLLIPLLVTSGAPAQQAEIINDQSGGIVELTTERELVVTGLQGHISLRLGRAGEMQYMARSLSNRRDERQVALLLAGGTLRLEPLAGLEDERILLEVVVPPELNVDVDILGSILSLNGLMSDIVVRAEDSDVKMSAMQGGSEFDLTGGTLNIGASQADIVLDCNGTEAKLQQIGGQLSIGAVESSIEITVLRDGLELDMEKTQLSADQVQGQVRANAREGELQLRGVKQGADLELSDCPLGLSDIEGGVRVETDAQIRFEDLKSDLIVNGYAAGVTGSGNLGGVQVTTDLARISLENIGGPVTVEGRDLEVMLRDLKGETRVNSVMSRIAVENSVELVDIQNEFGDIRVTKAAGQLNIRSTDGEVYVGELSGPIDLKAKGYMVEVAWSEMGGETDSNIVNEDGEIRLYLPENGRCRLEAESKSGNIDSSHRDVQVTDDGRFANGVFGGTDRPVIRAVAKGDMQISDSRRP